MNFFCSFVLLLLSKFSLALLPTHFMLNIWGHNVWSWKSSVTPHSWTHQTLPNWIQTLHKHVCTHTQTYARCVCVLYLDTVYYVNGNRCDILLSLNTFSYLNFYFQFVVMDISHVYLGLVQEILLEKFLTCVSEI